MGPLHQRYPRVIITRDNNLCPVLKSSKPGVFRLASDGSRTQQAPWMTKKGPYVFRFPQILVFIGSVSTCSTHTKDYITHPRALLARKSSKSAGSLIYLFIYFLIERIYWKLTLPTMNTEKTSSPLPQYQPLTFYVFKTDQRASPALLQHS